tara:strand:- start:10625 stop:10861 length:237 start_codon:yes stop_codon:yes gene_type:complete
MRNTLSSLALAFLVAGTPAMAAEPEQKAAQGEKDRPAAQDEASEPKKICRQVALQTGSRQRERVCMTKEQWREFNRGD